MSKADLKDKTPKQLKALIEESKAILASKSGANFKTNLGNLLSDSEMVDLSKEDKQKARKSLNKIVKRLFPGNAILRQATQSTGSNATNDQDFSWEKLISMMESNGVKKASPKSKGDLEKLYFGMESGIKFKAGKWGNYAKKKLKSNSPKGDLNKTYYV